LITAFWGGLLAGMVAPNRKPETRNRKPKTENPATKNGAG
jgi:hypothetical protein